MQHSSRNWLEGSLEKPCMMWRINSVHWSSYNHSRTEQQTFCILGRGPSQILRTKGVWQWKQETFKAWRLKVYARVARAEKRRHCKGKAKERCHLLDLQGWGTRKLNYPKWSWSTLNEETEVEEDSLALKGNLNGFPFDDIVLDSGMQWTIVNVQFVPPYLREKRLPLIDFGKPGRGQASWPTAVWYQRYQRAISEETLWYLSSSLQSQHKPYFLCWYYTITYKTPLSIFFCLFFSILLIYPQGCYTNLGNWNFNLA